jgi:hypothetical protein
VNLGMKKAINIGESGVSLTGLLVSIGVTGVIFLALSSFNSLTFQSYAGDTLETSLLAKQTQISSAIANPVAWQNTKNDVANPLLSCVDNNNCVSGATQNIIVHDSSNVIADSNTLGLGPSGDICNAYTVAGNRACPVRYLMTATVVCTEPSTKPCNLDPKNSTNQNTVIQITSTLQHGVNVPPRIAAINPQIYSFTQNVVAQTSAYSLICLTAQWNGSGAISSGNAMDGSGNTVFLSAAQAQAIMLKTLPYPTVLGPAPVGNYWGLQCLKPYGVSGCAGSMDGGSTDPSVRMSNNGCLGDVNNQGSGMVISITCCGSG